MYRMAFIGCGSMAGFIDSVFEGHPSVILPYSHAAAADSHPEIELAACADPSFEQLKRFGEKYRIPEERRYADFHAMLSEVKPDLVSVATPTEVHADATVAAARAGAKGIYCEKPMAPSLADADRMISACDDHGAKLVIAHPRRWNMHTRRIAQLLREGEIGRVTDLVGFSRGHLLGSGAHMFDTLRMFAGDAPAMWVVATLDEEPGPGRDPGGSGMVVFQNGIKAFVAASPGKAHLFEIEAAGTDGVIRSFNNGASHLLRKKAPPDEWPPLQEAPFPEPEKESGTVRALSDLIRAVETGETPPSDGRGGRATLELVVAFHLSHLQGKVRLDLPLSDTAYRIG
ncbi:MAG: Gfo/Idh/MocA family oxidoreductase [Armatimonadetes bacterium]|nr:Gfo/Idh/MocA family oxidoreductase [Armatimonadota bacterium]